MPPAIGAEPSTQVPNPRQKLYNVVRAPLDVSLPSGDSPLTFPPMNVVPVGGLEEPPVRVRKPAITYNWPRWWAIWRTKRASCAKSRWAALQEGSRCHRGAGSEEHRGPAWPGGILLHGARNHRG